MPSVVKKSIVAFRSCILFQFLQELLHQDGAHYSSLLRPRSPVHAAAAAYFLLLCQRKAVCSSQHQSFM